VLMVTRLPPLCQHSFRFLWYSSSVATTPTTFDEVTVPPDIARELRAVKRAREANDARAMAAVVKARDAECSLREIAELLGMTHTGVAKMERRARKAADGG
jgi:DNA-directed RNA polymerase specialized sigma24 family protein